MRLRLRLFEFEDLAWFPAIIRAGMMDYLRFMAQYGHLDITGGPRTISPLFAPADLTPINKRDYSVDTAVVRAQLEF